MRFLRVPGQLTERWLHSQLTINHLELNRYAVIL